MRILVSGASGLIGKNFVRQALREGHEIRALVRNPAHFTMLPKAQVIRWDHDSELNRDVFEGVDAVVNLAGENIAQGRWTNERKRLLVESRIKGTQHIVHALSLLPQAQRPRVFVSGSAIGFYGYSRAEELTEESPAGEDFLAKLCVDWENAARQAEGLGIRVALLRTGIVLSREGGALTKMPPVRIGNGQSWMSWIHIADMVQGLLFILREPTVRGAINLVAPHPVRNSEFVASLAKILKIPTFGFVPQTLLKLALGEMANALTSSLKVQPKGLLQSGFSFQYPDLEQALKAELSDHHILDRELCKDQFVPMTPQQVFPFFSRAENLETLTPPWLNFRIVGKSTDQIEQGTLIDYKLKIHGVPMGWRSRISSWKPGECFIDEQVRGPYSKWHHRHSFEAVPGGCLLRDQVTYRVPGSLIGRLLLGAWIEKDVTQIFAYRQTRVQELINSGKLN